MSMLTKASQQGVKMKGVTTEKDKKSQQFDHDTKNFADQTSKTKGLKFTERQKSNEHFIIL